MWNAPFPRILRVRAGHPAGPGGSGLKPEGRVCFGILRNGQDARTETIEFGALGRDKVRRAARDRALELLSEALG